MGISPLELRFLVAASLKGALRKRATILEFGESETFGIPHLAEGVGNVLGQIGRNDPWLLEEARRLGAAKSDYQRRFRGAKLFYKAVFDYDDIVSIDGLSTPGSICVDFNESFDLGRAFEVCINNGSAEHIFEIANVFRLMHHHTMTDGTMVHWGPSIGWLDHGLYNVQPGCFFDLAEANQYEVEFAALVTGEGLHELRSREDAKRAGPEFANSAIGVVLRKTSSGPFKAPFQKPFAEDGEIVRVAALNRRGLLLASPGRSRNIAIGRPTRQSSTSQWSYDDDPAIDSGGGNNGRITGHYGFHTDLDTTPWWEVDLLEEVAIGEIRVYNRLSNHCSHRACFLEIWLSNEQERWARVYAHNGQEFGGADGAPLQVVLSPSPVARFVRLRLPNQNYLHLDEVEVYRTFRG